jgi:hydrogenase maturation protease
MDDGIGPGIVMELKSSLNNPKFEYETSAVGGMELIEIIRDFNQVIIIDAIKTLNGQAGSVYHLTPRSFKETSHISNLHDISFLTALKLAENVGIFVTTKIDIIAIEIIEDRVFGNKFSGIIQEKYDSIKKEVQDMVFEITGSG